MRWVAVIVFYSWSVIIGLVFRAFDGEFIPGMAAGVLSALLATPYLVKPEIIPGYAESHPNR